MEVTSAENKTCNNDCFFERVTGNMNLDLNRPIILYMHAGSGNHGCEAIADTTIRLIRKLREESGSNINLPVILATNSVSEDRKYLVGTLESEGLCTIVEERHIDRKFVDHVLYYGYRKISGDRESFLRYRFRDVLRVYKKQIAGTSFDGQNSKKFYRMARLRERLGIKFNIEMIMLPGEMFKSNGSTFKVHFGKPVKWQDLNAKEARNEASRLRDMVYELKQS